MKRLLITGPRQVSFDECAEPKCPAGGVLVRAQLTAISSGTELRVYRAQPVDEEGRYLHENVPFELPTENGYSMVGEVIACGGTVADALGTPLSIGDRVFLATTHREMVVAPADSVFRVPDDIPSERAVFLNIVEVAHAALRSGAPHLGDDVAVVGQGVIGLVAALIRGPHGTPLADASARATTALSPLFFPSQLATLVAYVLPLVGFWALSNRAEARRAPVARWGLLLSVWGTALALPALGVAAFAGPPAAREYLRAGADAPAALAASELVSHALLGPGLAVGLVAGVCYTVGPGLLAAGAWRVARGGVDRSRADPVRDARRAAELRVRYVPAPRRRLGAARGIRRLARCRVLP